MHPADIKAALHKKGLTSKAVAAHFGITEGSVSQIINGHKKSRRVAVYISKRVRIPVAQLWPNSYPAVELAELKAA